MKKNKPLVKDKERVILQYIFEQGGSVTPNEISAATGISYITVKKYLAKLLKEKILILEHGKEKKKK